VRSDDRATVTLSPIATPLPLTFVGLLLASTILSGFELGWIPHGDAHGTGWVLVAVPMPLQLIAAVFGFRGRSASAATGSSTLAAAWLGIALALITVKAGAFTPTRPVGMLAFAVAAALVIPVASDAVGGSLLPAAALAVAAVRFVLTGILALTKSDDLRYATGVFGCFVAAVALYAALALELEGAEQRPVLPTFRRARSAMALAAPLDEQVGGLEHEAGVRKNL
jgi:succinate-acetate transporter protein